MYSENYLILLEIQKIVCLGYLVFIEWTLFYSINNVNGVTYNDRSWLLKVS